MRILQQHTSFSREGFDSGTYFVECDNCHRQFTMPYLSKLGMTISEYKYCPYCGKELK